MKTYPFNALVSRMKYIRRWSLMHAARPETLSEHTAETAILAHTLCLIAREVTGTPVRPETVAVAALYHDAPEIMTGDMPTPVKYKNERLRSAYKALEEESARQMAQLLPPALRPEMTGYLTGRCLSDAEKRILKAADRLSALIKCTEEVQAGNREFASALAQQKAAITAMHCPEADYFLIKELKPGFLDGVSGTYKDPDGYFVCEKDPDGFERFEATFPVKEKQKLPGQLF